jgi:hypothetical protein
MFTTQIKGQRDCETIQNVLKYFFSFCVQHTYKTQHFSVLSVLWSLLKENWLGVFLEKKCKYLLSGDTLFLLSSNIFMKCERFYFKSQVIFELSLNMNFGHCELWQNLESSRLHLKMVKCTLPIRPGRTHKQTTPYHI